MVFVTGGTGFIGAYIIKNLIEKGHPVRAIRRSANLPFFIPAEILDKVQWVDGDVLDVVALDEAMQDVEHVIHSAAVVSFSKKNRPEMYKVNIEGTANVVNAALNNNVKRFVHVSSIAAIGRSTTGDKVTEEKTWEEKKTNTHYAITKHEAEINAWRGFAEGLEGAIINPGTVLGFGNWHQSSCAVFKNIYKEFPWYTKGVSGFVGVEDVAEVAVRILFSDINEKRFIVNAENWVYQDLFNTIAEGFKKKRPTRYATPFLGELAWRMEAIKSFVLGQKPLLTRETAKLAHTKTYFDNSALLQALPRFEFNPIEEVIDESCKKYIKAIQSGQLTL
ncbi:MAG TPA: NAD-dependent epimerase/dehydratase family protein [Flavisolibacter sp.]|nr:NAD-dependent epimerase/dehydratase family protein [Flavisolibacter sp.]